MRAQELTELLIQMKALRFGSFVTKSGRPSPYFMDFGSICDGPAMDKLADLYAESILAKFDRCPDIVFGPAYKGIPLAVATASALSRRAKFPVSYAFDRKEAKAHGEGGQIVGRVPGEGDSVIIVDDVLTSGLSVSHSIECLKPTGCVIAGVVVGVDRCEQGLAGSSETAAVTLAHKSSIPVVAIATIHSVLESVAKSELEPELLERIKQYQESFGK